eukprot:74055_1
MDIANGTSSAVPIFDQETVSKEHEISLHNSWTEFLSLQIEESESSWTRSSRNKDINESSINGQDIDLNELQNEQEEIEKNKPETVAIQIIQGIVDQLICDQWELL